MFICFQCHLTAILPESASSGSPNLWRTSVQTVKSRNGNAQSNLLLHRSQGPPAAKQPAFQITQTRRELKLVLADWSVTSISAQDWSVPFAEIGDKALKSLMTPNLIPVHCFPGLVLLCLSLILVTRRQLPTDKTAIRAKRLHLPGRCSFSSRKTGEQIDEQPLLLFTFTNKLARSASPPPYSHCSKCAKHIRLSKASSMFGQKERTKPKGQPVLTEVWALPACDKPRAPAVRPEMREGSAPAAGTWHLRDAVP